MRAEYRNWVKTVKSNRHAAGFLSSAWECVDIIQPDSMHPMETAPVPTRLASLDSYEMHIYSVHNAGRAIFALSIRRAAVTLVVFTICAAACSAGAEQVVSA